MHEWSLTGEQLGRMRPEDLAHVIGLLRGRQLRSRYFGPERYELRNVKRDESVAPLEATVLEETPRG